MLPRSMKVKDVKFSDTWPLPNTVHLIFYTLCGSQLGGGNTTLRGIWKSIGVFEFSQ